MVLDVDQWVKTCYVCGILAPNQCAKCKRINYCCRSHQVYDWKSGHKEFCGTNNDIARNSQLLFPEYEIAIEPDDDEQDSDTSTCEKDEEEIKKYETMVKNGEAGTFQNEQVQKELLCLANQDQDETFSNFRTVTDKYPDQVLRYDRGGEILYISKENNVGEIPKCWNCNGKRQFEFQIMPQLLNFLHLKDTLKCIDWGILVIFTCKKSCIPKYGYSTEYVWKQDIVENNLDNVS